ncbi:hypothetical protein C0J52_11813, partial [Blattella germanica]
LGESGSGLRTHGDIQDFYKLREECLKKGIKFKDPDFPAEDSSMFYTTVTKKLIWKRPHEISSNPKLVIEGASRFDVLQGELGDCWLLAAMANLTLYDSLFKFVVPQDQSFSEKYAGIFHFRFWQYGHWLDVVVDDRLPTDNGKLVYLHSTDPNEYWSALLEKAYAKLHGSYEALKGGSTCEAMEDVTGGLTEKYELNESATNLFRIMGKAYARDTFWHNPQYRITLRDPDEGDDDDKCTIVVALMQKNRRIQRQKGMDSLTIGFSIYKLKAPDKLPKPLDLNFFKYNPSTARSPTFINLREVSARFKLPEGVYCIIPSTYEPNRSGEFLLRIIKRPTTENDKTDSVKALFRKIAGNDMEVDWKELKDILDYSSAKGRTVFKLYDNGSGFIGAFELRQALNSAGYSLNNHILNALVLRYSSKENLMSFDDFMMCAVRLKAMIGEFIRIHLSNSEF